MREGLNQKAIEYFSKCMLTFHAMKTNGFLAWIERGAECSVRLHLAQAQCVSTDPHQRRTGLTSFRNIVTATDVTKSDCVVINFSQAEQSVIYGQFARCLRQQQDEDADNNNNNNDAVKYEKEVARIVNTMTMRELGLLL